MKEYIVKCDNNKFTIEGEIVHCKDCEFCIVEEPISRGIIPDMYCRIWESIVNTDTSCSYGERKEKVQPSGETSTISKTETVDTDTISRQAIEYHTQLEARGNGQYEEVEVAYKSDIESLPPVEPKPTCEDAISRTDTVNALCRECQLETKCGGADCHENWCTGLLCRCLEVKKSECARLRGDKE